MNLHLADALAVAAAIRTGEVSAREVCATFLAEIHRKNPPLNCFTAILAEEAKAQAETIDQVIAQGETVGALAGVPFAVKNLFDVAGLTTLAGAKIEAEKPAAITDATAVAKLKQAGAVLVGALNMDEYAYGFVTENAHYGTTHNPHDLNCMAGGSSGGSAAAVAGGLVPCSLGSETNGSVRVPAALCGIYGLKPTYGRISRAGVFLFSSSLDHVGFFARSVRDLAMIFDTLQGADPRDPVSRKHPLAATRSQLNQGIAGLRMAIADDYFTQNVEPEILAAVEKVAQALKVQERMTIPEAHRARAAAFMMTASEGANFHLENLRSRPQDFDPATRDRFLAGALIPAHWYVQSQRFRRWFRDRMTEIFQQVDVILAPCTPCVAPRINQQTMTIAGQEMLVRPNLGLFTQPLSFIGLPVLSVPIQRPNALPIGIQIIAAPDQEALILRVAAWLEAAGITAAPVVSN